MGQFNSSLNNRYLIETYQNGWSWYRVYSDGWCEQGSFAAGTADNEIQTVWYPRTFSSVKSVVLTQCQPHWTNYAANSNLRSIGNQTFEFVNQHGAFWVACGYI